MAGWLGVNTVAALLGVAAALIAARVPLQHNQIPTRGRWATALVEALHPPQRRRRLTGGNARRTAQVTFAGALTKGARNPRSTLDIQHRPRPKEPLMPNPVPARYRDAHGVLHDLRVHRNAEGHWEVLDIVGEDRRVVDVLLGYEEARGEAEALARDFAAQHHNPEPPADRNRRGPDRYGFAA